MHKVSKYSTDSHAKTLLDPLSRLSTAARRTNTGPIETSVVF